MLLAAAPPVAEVLAERLILHLVPADPDAEAESPPGEQVDLGRLLRDQGGLALGQDDHASDQFQRGQCGQVAEENEGLAERGPDIVGPVPRTVDGWVGSEYVVVDQHVPVSSAFDLLPPDPDSPGVVAEFGLGEDGTDA